MNADNILFRCSSLGHIMTPAKSKNETLSESCKTHLTDLFVSTKYKRREEIDSKFFNKGNAREEDSITLLSRVNKIFFKKNDIRLSNEFISGEPDIFLGESIYKADETFDTKTSWSAHTFFRAQKDELNKMYKYQGIGYMALSEAKKHTVAYCLVNGTQQAIIDEKRRASYRYDLTNEDEYLAYKKRCKQIEINMIYDINSFASENKYFDFDNDLSEWDYDIPMAERIFTFSIYRNEDEIQAIYDRIKECRKWMNENLFKVIPVSEKIELIN